MLATTAGIALLDKGKVKEAIDAVCTPLRLVGPATATAILAPLSADGGVPFFSDELLEVVSGTRVYSPKQLHTCIAYLQKKCTALNRLQMDKDTGMRQWTPEGLQQAMWVYGHTHCHSDSHEGGARRKRTGAPSNEDGGRVDRPEKRSK